MAEASRKGHAINFDVLHDAKGRNYFTIGEEIGRAEGEYIRQYRPILNTQIPKAEDWHKFDVQNLDARKVLKEIL